MYSKPILEPWFQSIPNEYYDTDLEDPYEWIQSVEKAAQANNWR